MIKQICTFSVYISFKNQNSYDLKIDSLKKFLITCLFMSFAFCQTVIVNTKSNKIHKSNVLHLPDIEHQKEYQTKEMAIKDGKTLCSACFDMRLNISDYDLEREIAAQSIMAVQNNYEVIYEYPQLEKYSLIMKKVLNRWPEKLIGYDYRIQILKDDLPNALAIAGGNIYLTTGLIDIIEDDKELESILAHEIAHVERRHTIRSFKLYQQKALGAKAIGLMLATLSVASGSNNAEAFSQLFKVVVDYAAVLSTQGYSRELESEADMYAQLYFQKNKESSTHFLFSLDKLSNFYRNRLGYVPISNKMSSHPSIQKRINKVKNGRFVILDEPIVISLIPMGFLTSSSGPRIGGPPIKPIASMNKYEKRFFEDIGPNFITMEIDKFFIGPSVEKNNFKEFTLFGKIINNSKSKHFAISQADIKLPLNMSKATIEGLKGINIISDSETNFSGNISISNEISESFESALINKKLMSDYFLVNPLNMDSKKSKRSSVSYTQRIACAIAIK